VVAPAATPPPIVALLNRTFHDLVEEPAIHAEMGRRGLIPVATDPPDKLRQFVKAEIVRWGELAKQAGIAASQ
jgi:tripartite-type tricarboxylate transporter receptor subunit TctC